MLAYQLSEITLENVPMVLVRLLAYDYAARATAYEVIAARHPDWTQPMVLSDAKLEDTAPPEGPAEAAALFQKYLYRGPKESGAPEGDAHTYCLQYKPGFWQGLYLVD